MTAQTMVRQLVSKVQGVHLIGAPSHIAEQALNGIGAPDVTVHDRWKSIKGQEMLFTHHSRKELGKRGILWHTKEHERRPIDNK